MATRTGFVGALLVLLLVAWSGTASAHAALAGSDPAPGASLHAAPGVVVLHFSEPLIESLSGATVTDPDGTRFTSRPSGRTELQVVLQTNASGVYHVDWHTVSPLDGHSLAGSFEFGVGVKLGGSASSASSAPSGTDLLLGVGRFVEDVALLMAAGMLLVTWLSRREPRLDWPHPHVAIALGVAFAAGIAVVGGEAWAAAGSVGRAGNFFASHTGSLRLVRVGLEGLALAACWRSARAAALMVAAALVALAASGHAAAVTPQWWGVIVDAGHLLSASLWAGGLLALATLHPPGGWRSGNGRALVVRFSRVALPAFVATVGFGVLRGAQELAGVSDLATTGYGQVLVIKIALALAMLPLSVIAWRRRVARPRLEGALAATVVAAAAMLAAFPFPPARERAAESREHAVTHPAALPHATDLTLGSNAGSVLVGLTVRPGRPGTNQLLLYVLPPNGEQAAGRLSVDLAVNGRPLGLETCGATCRKTTADLAQGDEVVTVGVAGPGGGTATFRLPHLPAADATDLITETTATMNTLHTFRTDELFGPQQPPLHTIYAIEAPDRIRLRILNTGLERIRIGTTTYERATPTSPWTTETGGPSFEVPELIWDYPGITAAHVLGSATLDGKAMTIVSFFVNVSNLPIWYRLWIDPQTHLAHRAEMRTQNHFMDHQYDAFDQPVDIVAP